ncbi:MAG: heme b synthase [Deltaproteobacteria bacterium RBG_13_43_22]|nr:MAG: heme b synthase [Deltaproteobacteria bacterium RBG_13_43_22]
MPSQMEKENQFPPQSPELRLVAWEVTRQCNLSCLHCRASAEFGPYPDELSTAEGLRLLDQIREVGQPVVILTGGEPLLHSNIFELARYGHSMGLRMVMAVNGTLLNIEKAQKLKESGIQRISISMDGASAESHDFFRQVRGAFKGILKGIEAARAVDLEFQINTTVTRYNLHELPLIQEKVIELGAAAHHIFMLVPTGRGRSLTDQTISAEEYEKTLTWLVKQKEEIPLSIKATCAPHYYRILREIARKEGKEITFKSHGLDAVTRGCLGGVGFCFVSHVGLVQPCGYLEINSGNIRKQTFREIWESSPIFLVLRDQTQYSGKCGYCEYFRVCGGCRARAFEATGNFLDEEPFCTYQPKK